MAIMTFPSLWGVWRAEERPLNLPGEVEVLSRVSSGPAGAQQDLGLGEQGSTRSEKKLE
jgi:hypothetical protein